MLPHNSSEDKGGFFWKMRARPLDRVFCEQLADEKLADNGPGSYPPLMVFHPSITNTEELHGLIKRMMKNEDVNDEDKLYVIAGNHNYTSNTICIEKMKSWKREGWREQIKVYETMNTQVFCYPGKDTAQQNVDLIMAVSFFIF